MQYPHGTTIAVTDGRKLRLFRNTGDEVHLKLQELPQPDVHGREEGAARHHHVGQDSKDQQRLHDRREDRQIQKESFEAAVAAWLNHEVLTGRLGSLFIVAPPHVLGVLRPHYHAALKEKLLGELGKEHTHDKIEFLHDALVKG